MDSNLFWQNFQKGDNDAFSKLYDLLWEDLFCYTARLLQDKEIASDIVQEVFTKLWENRHQAKNIDNIKSYLYKSARNSTLNSIREYNIKEKHLAAFQMILNAEGVDSTMQEILGKDMKTHIQRSIETLPERMREVFYLKVFEQLSVKEIAERMHLSEQTVRNQMSLATQRLKHVFVALLVFFIQK